MFIGQPVLALVIGVLFSFLLIRGKDLQLLNGLFDKAVEKAGPIIIVTAAGGMFGTVIRETGIGTEAGKWLSGWGVSLLVPFLMALILKTAQGSSTVAIITALSIRLTSRTLPQWTLIIAACERE